LKTGVVLNLAESGCVRRRDFIKLVAGCSVVWPLAARAQRAERVRRIGVLIGRSENDPEGQRQAAALEEALDKLRWSIGRNLEIFYRWHPGDLEQARALAKELTDLSPDLLVVGSTPSLAAVRERTRDIPIVAAGAADLVAQGFVQSLSHPGGNITGFVTDEPSMAGKWVELMHEIAPHSASVTVLFNKASAPFARLFLPSMEAAAASSSMEFLPSPVENDADIERVVTAAGRRESAGLVVLPDTFLIARRKLIVGLAADRHVPAVYPIAAFAVAGGLVSYGIDRVALYRNAASYVDRILKGERPADLPVQVPTTFELVVNLKTAKALGMTVPPGLLTRADKVIE
jgi:putative tryptophan/tyrosine transport system substrate-binding protein